MYKMTILRSINYSSMNKNVVKVLIDGKMNIILPYNNEIFEYRKTDGGSNKIIIAEFKYKSKVVRQAFYQCTGKYKGTWLPFDGVKADVNEDNEFYTFLDTDAIGNLPFGNDELKSVSYILGGGVWESQESEFAKSLGVEPRMSYFDELHTKLIQPQDSIYLNHYINYAISDNYLGKPVKWLDGEELKNAFSYSNKMENSYQLEYTPKRIKGAKSRLDYSQLYAKINNSHVKVLQVRQSNCAIL